MNFAQYAKAAVMTGLVTVAFWGQPQVAQAAEIVAPNDDVIVETSDAASSTGDPEWRYVPVRRTANADTANAEGGTTKGNGGGGDFIVFDING